MTKTKIEWTFRDGRHIGRVGDWIDATVAECDGRQLATVYLSSRSRHESVEYDDALCSTTEAAKAAAQEIVNHALAPFLATARTEAALAEREACAEIAEARSRWAADGSEQWGARGEAFNIAVAIRDRSKSETQPAQEQLFDDAAAQAGR